MRAKMPQFLPFHWRIDAPRIVDKSSLGLIEDTLYAIRLVGVLCRLYHPDNKTILDHARQAVASLTRLFAERPSLTLTFDGHSLAADGQLMQFPELPIASFDYRYWLEFGHLQALGLAPGLTAHELLDFLRVLVAHEPIIDPRELFETIAALRLHHLQVLNWHALLPIPYEFPDCRPGFTHQSILAFLHGSAMRTDHREQSLPVQVEAPA